MDVQLSREDLELLSRPVAGRGGWQSLLRKLQKQINGSVLTLTEDDSRKILRYILSYGSGGWQDRLAAIAGKSSPSRSTARKSARKK